MKCVPLLLGAAFVGRRDEPQLLADAEHVEAP
jgi:hypothetical protein